MFRCEKSKYIGPMAVQVLRIMITRYKEGIAIEALVQDGFYLAELRVDFLADFVAQS